MAQPPANLLMLVLVGLALVAWPPPSTAEDSLPPLLSGKAPQNLDELWGGYDPIKEPLEVEVTREWEADGVICRLVRYRVGVFKGAKSIMAAIYAFPKGRGKLPGLIQVHGGGQAASPSTAIDDANRGYACISVNWGGNPLRLGDAKYDGPNTDWGGRSIAPIRRRGIPRTISPGRWPRTPTRWTPRSRPATATGLSCSSALGGRSRSWSSSLKWTRSESAFTGTRWAAS